MDGWATTYQTSVRMNTQASDNASGLAGVQVRDAGGSWSGWSPDFSRLSWVLPAITGQTHTVEVQYKDLAGNVSNVYSDSIFLDIYPDRPSSQNYQLQRSTFGMSATDGQSGNYQLKGTLSQVSAAGYSESTLYKIVSGFWQWLTGIVNAPPVVGDIPDQIITAGETFLNISLDDYVEDPDDADSEISWTYSGNTELMVSIMDRVASISVTDSSWTGQETITFKATDPGSKFDEDAASFSVTAENGQPVVSDIPDQSIAEGDGFTDIQLDDFVSDIDNSDSEMTWSYSGNTELLVSIIGRVASISIPSSGWTGQETIAFKATDPGGKFDENSAVFTVTAGNVPPVANSQSVTTLEDVAKEIVLTGSDAEGSVLNFEVTSQPTKGSLSGYAPNLLYTPDNNLNGSDHFSFKVNDGLVDSQVATVSISVTAVNDPPVIIGQAGVLTTVEDTALEITLSDINVTDIDNAYPEDFQLIVQNGTNYQVTNKTITPAAGFIGTLTIPVKVNDGSDDSNEYDLSVTVMEEAPPPPVITNLYPTQRQAGSAQFTISVNGTAFQDGDTIYWNGSPLETTFINSTQLTAVVNPVNILAVDYAEITVVHLGFEEYPSNALTFTVYSFADVLPTHPLWKFVEGFFAKGITTGCAVNPMRYCPDQAVTRAQMAVFLLRSIHADDPELYVPEDVEPDTFADSPAAAFMEPWIEQFYATKITTGCAAAPLRYCPERNVTRGEMAVFVLRALHKDELPYTPTPSPSVVGIFADVPASNWMKPWIEEFYELGITTGCGTSGDKLLYCPNRNVNRAEMATFVDRAFGFPPLP